MDNKKVAETVETLAAILNRSRINYHQDIGRLIDVSLLYARKKEAESGGYDDLSHMTDSELQSKIDELLANREAG